MSSTYWRRVEYRIKPGNSNLWKLGWFLVSLSRWRWAESDSWWTVDELRWELLTRTFFFCGTSKSIHSVFIPPKYCQMRNENRNVQSFDLQTAQETLHVTVKQDIRLLRRWRPPIVLQNTIPLHNEKSVCATKLAYYILLNQCPDVLQNWLYSSQYEKSCDTGLMTFTYIQNALQFCIRQLKGTNLM